MADGSRQAGVQEIEITEEMCKAAYRAACESGLLYNELYDNESSWEDSPVWREILQAALEQRAKAPDQTRSARSRRHAIPAATGEVVGR